MPPKAVDLTGNKYGMLTVVERAGTKHMQPAWLCQCECGEFAVALGGNLKRGMHTTCGKHDKTGDNSPVFVHGYARTRTYNVWAAVKQRCCDTNAPVYQRYGAQGVVVCDRWNHSFEAFLEDMGERPEGVSIDRIDNSGGYTCGKCEQCLSNSWTMNCRWATRSQQMRNTSITIMLTIDGVTKPMMEWCDQYGVKPNTVRWRIYDGWSHKDAIFRPVRSKSA